MGKKVVFRLSFNFSFFIFFDSMREKTHLAIVRPVEYNIFMSVTEDFMKYMTANQASKKWNISQRRVQILCAEGRVPGVFKLGEAWAIPLNVEKPGDNRRKRKNGKV